MMTCYEEEQKHPHFRLVMETGDYTGTRMSAMEVRSEWDWEKWTELTWLVCMKWNLDWWSWCVWPRYANSSSSPPPPVSSCHNAPPYPLHTSTMQSPIQMEPTIRLTIQLVVNLTCSSTQTYQSHEQNEETTKRIGTYYRLAQATWPLRRIIGRRHQRGHY